MITMSSKYVSKAGATIFYETQGTGEPLILIHSGVADMRLWNPQMDAFTQEFQVIRYDARGYGQSELIPGDFHHLDDLIDLMEHLNLKSGHLLGLSMGGETAIDLALRHPERVRSLTLVGSGLGGWEFKDPFTMENLQKMEKAFEEGDILSAKEAYLSIWLAGPNRSLEDVDEELRNIAFEMLPQFRENPSGRAMPVEPLAISRLSEIKAPTIVIVGDGDTLELVEIADLLASEIPNASKHVMIGVAHYPNMENPDEFNRIVIGFLKQVTQLP